MSHPASKDPNSKNPVSKSDVMDALRPVQRGLAETVATMPRDHFERPIDEGLWSPDFYLRHLILSSKPFVRVLEMRPDGARRLFPPPERPSMSYAELVNLYETKLAEGVRAEAVPQVTPDGYRFPDDVTDRQAFLLRTWNDTGDRLSAALDQWSESDLDAIQIPHPAIGMLTVREMLFFTLHHNTLHWGDIRRGM